MNWAHIQKALKQIHQEVIRLKSTGPKKIRVTTTQLEKKKIWRTWKCLEDLECGKKNSPKSEMKSKCSSSMVHQIRRGLSKEVENSWSLAVGVKKKSKQRKSISF